MVVEDDTSDEDLDYFIHHNVDAPMHADEFARFPLKELQRLRQILAAKQQFSSLGTAASETFGSRLRTGASARMSGPGRREHGAAQC